jgi:outer membrane receptor protein involved in Fe transport
MFNMQSQLQRVSAIFAASILSLPFIPVTVVAQEPAGQEPVAEPANPGDKPAELKASRDDLEEILVTARKRTEKLQDVPISISAFTAQGLRDRNIQDAYDLAKFTPNFQLNTNLGRRLDNPIIRGQFGPLIGSTPNASFFIDGVFVAGSIGSTNVANLERIEVLRGPQSASFGRATFAGAINYITRKATNEFEGEVNGQVGEHGRRDIGIWASGPIIQDKLFFFAGASKNKWDGEWRNGLEPYDVVGGYSSTGYQQPPDFVINEPYGQDFFGGFSWDENPQLAGDPPCLIGDGNNDANCAPTVGDNTELGGTDTETYTIKLTLDATEFLQFNAKYERANADDDHIVYNFIPPGTENHCYNRSGGGSDNPIFGVQPPPGTVLDTSPDRTVGTRSPGALCGAINDNGYVPKLNIPNLRRGVTVSAPGRGPASTPPAPFLGMDETVDRYFVDAISDINDYELVVRYAHNERESQYVRDLDRSYGLGPVATGLFEAYTKDEDEDDSAEIRLSSPGDRRLRWLVGGYWFDYEQQQFQRNFTGFGNSFILGGTGSQEITNTAVFGNIEFDINDDWTFAFEARYAKDEISRKSSEYETPSDLSSIPCERKDIEPNPDFDPLDPDSSPTQEKLECEENFYSFTPRATLTWNVKDDGSMTAYAQIADGNKPGGFNFGYFDGDTPWDSPAIDFQENVVIDEEEATTYEIGLKGSYFDNTLTANLAVFYIDWENQSINARECIPQIDAPCQENNIVRNAGESEVKGLELEMSWFPTERQTYSIGYGYTDSELKEYVDKEFAILQCPNSTTFPDPGTGCFEFSGPGGTISPDAQALINELGDVSGNEAPRTPKHNFAASQLYVAPFFSRNIDWYVRNDVLYESKKYTSPANLSYTPEQWVWNGRLGLQTDGWDVSFYVDNITNEKSPLQIQTFPLFDQSEGYSISPDEFVYQDSYLILPRRERNAGVVFTVRFGPF